MIPNSKFSKICVKAILALLFAVLTFLFIKSLSTVSIFAVRFKAVVHQRTLVYIFLSIVLMLIIFAIFKLIDNCSKKKLTIITIVSFAVIILIQVFFSFYFHTLPTDKPTPPQALPRRSAGAPPACRR